MDTIRNFSIIAHIDHGKSTLADRMLEITGTVPDRKMRDQILDQMELERERGITIKMQPVTMRHTLEGKHYVLNLIDTPGHIDFAYEVSRALAAVDGAVLLVDATQGIEAQTLTTLSQALDVGLTIIPVVSKVDSVRARTNEVREEISQTLNCKPSDVLLVSGKTGEGVSQLLARIIHAVSPPQRDSNGRGELQALVFDFTYSSHRGIVIHTRLFDGSVTKGDTVVLKALGKRFNVVEVGIFAPEEMPQEKLSTGEIGYIVTGIKKPGIASVGDTVISADRDTKALPGYEKPQPVVWASTYPERQDDFDALQQALERLRLTDSSLSYEEESSGVLGRGFRCGFLGMLHLEIVIERLRREFNLALTVTTPTITYEVTYKNGKTENVYSPVYFPDYGEAAEVHEPWVEATIITPSDHLNNIMQVLHEYEARVEASTTFGDGRVSMFIKMPLRELMRGFFDTVKSVSSGYASISYKITEMRSADVVRLDVLVAEEPVAAFARIVSRRRVDEEAKRVVKRLHDILPRQLFATKIQARALGRILSAKTLKALRKDVTGHLYGGDVTRKRKLLEKQKKGKKKMKASGRVHIPQEVFMKMVQG